MNFIARVIDVYVFVGTGVWASHLFELLLQEHLSHDIESGGEERQAPVWEG